METSVDDSKFFSLIPEKVTHGPILLLLQLCTVGHIGMRIFSFVVLSAINAPRNVSTPYISKTNLSIVSRMWTQIELMLKILVKEKGSPSPCVCVEAQLSPGNLKIY